VSPKQPLAFILLIFALNTAASDAKPLKVEDFVRSYLQQSSSLKQAGLELDKASLKAEASQDPYRTYLNNGVKWQGKKEQPYATVPSQDIDTLEVSAGVTQSLPRGASLSLDHKSQYVRGSLSPNLRPATDTALTLSLEVFKKLAGDEFVFQNVITGKQKSAAALNLSRQSGVECLAATRLFVDTYYRQEILILYRANLKDAEEIFRRYKDLYGRGHVQKIDLLRAKQDFYNAKTVFEDQNLNLTQARLKLASFMTEPLEGRLMKPDPLNFRKNLDLKSPTTKNAPLREELKANADAALAKLALSRIETRPDLNMSLSLGRYAEESLTTTLQPREKHGSYISLGVEFTLPISDRSQSDKVREAALDHKLALEAITKSSKGSERELALALATLKSLGKKSGFAKSRLEVAELQQKEARRLVDLARMDLTNYIQDRTTATNQKIDYLRTQLSEVNTLLNIREAIHKIPGYCQKGA
jgi:hypothetical protein